MVKWPFHREKRLKDDLTKLLEIEHTEINTEKMTEDVARQLEYIMKQVNEGKITLTDEKKEMLADAIKKYEKQVTRAKFQIKEIAQHVVALSRGR